MQSDSEIIERVFAGQREAYAVLVGRYESLARAAATRIVHDPHLAEDVAQEAFVAAFRSLTSLRSNSRFGAWLLGIVRRTAARALRERRRSPVVAAHVGSQFAPESSGRLSSESQELLELVERLPDQERLLIGLRHFGGHSMREIADITGRPLGTVTKQLSRAHRRLRNWLEREIE